MVDLTTHCERGHERTPENKYRYPSRGYTGYDCRVCRKEDGYGKRPATRLSVQKALARATIKRVQITECGRCPPSMVTGKRPRVVPDAEGDMCCINCGRGPKVTITLRAV